ncbi:MAG: glutamine-hydrolyzing GMP synthase [Candidatus Levybacteria bacterium]|nr:glutamine-hydrolyzing GMP synthase [Candidatus Levybacteria bacterium]
MICIIDFGSQTTHLIARRIKELGAATEIVSPKSALSVIKKEKPKGIILSGGPAGVYEKGAPTVEKEIFNLDIPILSICYGFQLTCYLLGGEVISGKKEYGPVNLQMANGKWQIAKDLPKSFVVWMSHGDEIIRLPDGFEVVGQTDHVPFAFANNKHKNITGLLFHPEVEHTENGLQILKNFITICGSTVSEHFIDIKELIVDIKKTVGDSYVIGAVSGGVDSTVAGVLTAEAIGEKFIPIFVDNGLMREGTAEHVEKIFTKHSSKPIVVNAVGEMLERLKGITDSERKRKVIGNFYIEIFEKEMEKILASGKDAKFLMQGTIYSDVIESGAVRRPDQEKDKGTKHAAKIKSHHNVGGLPEEMKLELLEPLRNFYKDEVRQIGKELGLPDEFVYKQPFPGPGYAVRIRGEVTVERLEQEKQADKIVLEELEKAGVLHQVFISFPVMTGAFSTAVKGDGRHFGEVVALRIIESKDIMTTTWSRLPYDLLQKISSRIVNEVMGISRVVYDITTKPPATMEWE